MKNMHYERVFRGLLHDFLTDRPKISQRLDNAATELAQADGGYKNTNLSRHLVLCHYLNITSHDAFSLSISILYFLHRSEPAPIEAEAEESSNLSYRRVRPSNRGIRAGHFVLRN